MAVHPSCVGRRPGDLVCEGVLRRACGVDLLTLNDAACPINSACAGSGTLTECMCNPGYVTFAGMKCQANADECKAPNVCSGTSSHGAPFDYPCVDYTGGTPFYTCLGAFADWHMPDAVAGSKFQPSYDLSGEAIVVDRVTTLQWQRLIPGTSGSTDKTYVGCTGKSAVAGDRCTNSEARGYCESLVLAGRTDWRLPSKIELESIIDETRTAPATNPDAFPNTPTEAFWTASQVAGSFTHAWFVHFNSGSCYFSIKTDALLVRCVR